MTDLNAIAQKIRPTKKEKEVVRAEYQRVFGQPAPEGVRAFQLVMWINNKLGR
jgi:hypothetical protein